MLCPHPHPAAQGVRAGQVLGKAATGTSTSPGLGVSAALGSSTARGTGAGQASGPTGGRGQLPPPEALRTWLSPLADAGTLVPMSSCCQAAHWQTCADNNSSQPACSSSCPWGCITMGVGRTPAPGPPGTLASGVPREASTAGMPTLGVDSVPGDASSGVQGCQLRGPWGCQLWGPHGLQTAPPRWLPVPPVPWQSGAVSRPSASRDWYMNGNYLVILVSVTIILPLALMKQLGKSGGCCVRHRGPALWGSRRVTVPAWGWQARRGHPASVGVLPVPTGCSLSSPGYLGYASGFSLSCMGFFLISVSTCRHIPEARDAKHPFCQSAWLCCLGPVLRGQQGQWGQQALRAVETPWQCCHAAGLFSAEGAEHRGKGKGEGAGGGEPCTRPLRVPPPCSAPLPTLTGQARGPASPWGTAGKGCPIEGTQRGHLPTGCGAGSGGWC